MDAMALARRATAVLFRPTAAWEMAAAETTSVRELMLGYVGPLAAIPAVCGGVSKLLGFSIADVGLRSDPLTVVIEAIAGFAMMLVVVWLAGQMVGRLASLFGGVADGARGVRLVAYSGTAFWLAGLLYLVPGLEMPAALLGLLWSLYLFHRGLPVLLAVPEDRVLTCFAACLLLLGVVAVVWGIVVAMAANLGGPLLVA